jgi:ribonucleotide monophosphatase NagD (HAD superfamily)
VVADDDGFPFVETVNAVITTLYRRIDAGRTTHLVVPNPDLVYPSANGAVGFTAGAIAALLEAVIGLRAPAATHRFTALGKPHRPMFQAALRRIGADVDRRRIVMIGDQVVTDIRGARDFGIDSVLIEGGVGRAGEMTLHGAEPTWLLAGLSEP